MFLRGEQVVLVLDAHRDVLHHAEQRDDLAIRVLLALALAAERALLAVGPQDAAIDLVIGALDDGALEGLQQQPDIALVQHAVHRVERRHERAALLPENPVQLVRPFDVFRADDPAPVADMAERFRLLQLPLVRAQGDLVLP